MILENMPLAEALAIAGVSLYLLVLLLFLRYLVWWRITRKKWWCHPTPGLEEVENLAREKKMDLPFFSILVPAREEADVIANTIDHMSGLQYPPTRYEILVVTDAKEWACNPYGPTTQHIVNERIKELASNPSCPVIKHVEVPVDFDGRLHGILTGTIVPSTKGRALNYGLSFLDPRSRICAIFDAESRPEKVALLAVARSYLQQGGGTGVWQGPLFQVRNYHQLKVLNKLAALFQAVVHEWYLPILMEDLPFVGGTNLYITRNLIFAVGGYDPKALSEDLDLGVRIVLSRKVWPQYLPVISTEQTPSTYRAFFRQRLRWGSGHLQVVDKMRYTLHFPEEKKAPLLQALCWKGHYQWIFFQMLVIAPFLIMAASIIENLDYSSISPLVLQVMAFTAPIYYIFAYFLYFRYRRYIDQNLAPKGLARFLHFLELPVATLVSGLFFVFPFTAAWFLWVCNRQPQLWVKTPRTKEISH